ncbi:PAS domain-containing protein [Flavobacterium hydatis]|uniref:Histidine kinase n=1 Tax=Flavobacterium hydatis TaxID=991 RepID=A0A086ARN7_FLAHY|nr:PAS domain-containing protein [Flavobacterium hydatis]KFF19351.1 histidine kinase [Flavobacterium hydatis]OXA96515.1 histidine kinase [Flavobacterium hydatis]
MFNLDAYDAAIAKYHQGMNCNVVPVISWDFHHEFLNDLKTNYTDWQRVNNISKQFNWDESEFDVLERLKDEVVVITDLELKIVFASNRIVNMTGYTEVEVLGKTPKMFQGPETSSITTNEIRAAIESQEIFEKTLLNYKKNGETYLCTVNAFPVFNLKGKLTHFIAFEKAA